MAAGECCRRGRSLHPHFRCICFSTEIVTARAHQLLLSLGFAFAVSAFAFSLLVVGAVEVWAQSVMGLLMAAAFLAALAAGRLHPLPGDEPRTRVRLLLPEAFLLGIVLLGLVQLVPLPV